MRNSFPRFTDKVSKEDEDIYKLRHDLKKVSITQQPSKHRADEVGRGSTQRKGHVHSRITSICMISRAEAMLPGRLLISFSSDYHNLMLTWNFTCKETQPLGSLYGAFLPFQGAPAASHYCCQIWNVRSGKQTADWGCNPDDSQGDSRQLQQQQRM